MIECYCPNVQCDRPANPVSAQFCHHCGTPLWLGDRYQLRRPLGSGRRVFWAVAGRSPDSTDCVIERYGLPAHPPSANPTPNPATTAQALLLREALALESLGQHPAVPRWLGQLSAHGCQFVVWEAIAGPTLAQELAEGGPFSLTQVCDVAHQLLPVLHHLHGQGILHRNLSPAMVIRRQNSPASGHAAGSGHALVLVGFGGMKLATATALAQPGTTTGIAAYTAPEQLMGQATFASDVYSLGVVLLHLLTGIHPFDLFSTLEDRWVWRDFWGALDPQVADELAHSTVPQALDRLIARGLRDRAPSAIAAWSDWFPGQTMPQLARTPTTPSAQESQSSPPVQSPALSPSSPWQRVGTGSGHTGQITALRWLDDHTWISASWDSTLRVWRSPDRAPAASRSWSSLQSIQTVTGHSSVVTGLARSPDGQTLASISWDATLRLWQRDPQATSSPLEPLAVGTGHRGWITAIAAGVRVESGTAAPGTPIAWITGGSDRTLRTWSATGELLATITGLAADPTAIVPTPEGHGCLWGDASGQLYCAPCTPGRPITPLLPARPTDSGAPTGAIVGLQWLVSRPLAPPAAAPVSAALASNHALIVAWASGTWQRYDWIVAQPNEIRAFPPAGSQGHSTELTALTLHPNGRDWVTAGRDRTVILWDGATGQPGDRLTHSAIPTAIALAPKGRAIAVGTEDRRVHLWQP